MIVKPLKSSMLTDYNPVAIVAQMPANGPIRYENCKDPQFPNIRTAVFEVNKNGKRYVFAGCVKATDGWCIGRGACWNGNNVNQLDNAYDMNAGSDPIPEKYGVVEKKVEDVVKID